jgi:class 3 adenylate cyclase
MPAERKQTKVGLEREVARLLTELRESLDRQTATAEVLRTIASAPAEAERALDTIAKVAARLFGASDVNIMRLEGGVLRHVATLGELASAVETAFPDRPLDPSSMPATAILERRPLHIVDLSAPDVRARFPTARLPDKPGSTVAAPLMREGEAIGAIVLVRHPVRPFTGFELAQVQNFADQAVIAIENSRMVNELRNTNAVLENVSGQLAKYIAPQLYHSIISGEQNVTIESKRKKLTIFFSDIVGFTEITDQLESEELTALLNEYLTAMSKIAEAHGATFDKFIGDAIMCYFGDPETKGAKGDATACVRMALEMQERLRALQSGWQEHGLIDRPFMARMGINTGYCTVGNFGSDDRMDYTIIGSEVNLAARLEPAAEIGGILLANETYSLVRDWLLADEAEAITVKGFSRPIKTFRVRGIREESDAPAVGIHRERPGMTVTIEPERMNADDKARAISVLKELQALLAG